MVVIQLTSLHQQRGRVSLKHRLMDGEPLTLGEELDVVEGMHAIINKALLTVCNIIHEIIGAGFHNTETTITNYLALIASL